MSAISLVDPGRRRRLVVTTSLVGGAGLAAAAVPFVASLSPSERARAQGAPVELDVQAMQADELKTVEWRGKPVFVLRRSPAMLASLARHDDLLADPLSKRGPNSPPSPSRPCARSSPSGSCCWACARTWDASPAFTRNPECLISAPPGRAASIAHATVRSSISRGRVFKNVPAPTNLAVPPYHFTAQSTLLIGANPAA
jgi:ubiquinol-cytochrome c reductase iron-sulfur subunit